MTAKHASLERWYVVHTKSGEELSAVQHLRRQGFCVFLPRTYRTLRHARRMQTVMRAFFPGYLFVRLDLTCVRWRAIEGTRGVRCLLKANDAPAPAPPGVVEALMARSDSNDVIDLAGALDAGHHVRVLAGPFADQLAIVERPASGERVRVLLNLMNQVVPVDLLRRDLATA